MRNSAVAFIAMTTLCSFAIAGHAQNNEALAQVSGGSTLAFYPNGSGQRFSITVAGHGLWLREIFEDGVSPVFQPVDRNGDPLPNGVYQFEFRLLDQKSSSGLLESKPHPTEPIAVQRGAFQNSSGTIQILATKDTATERTAQ